MKLHAHVRHIPTGKLGTVMSLWERDGIQYACVVVDKSGGCDWMNYAVSEWEVI